jgi:DNA-damage-inducible protein J
MTTLTQNKNFTIRLDAKVKEEAEKLFADLGMTLSGAMNIFLHQALIVRGLPFEVRQEQPNRTTLAAMKEAIRLADDPKTRHFKTVDELMEDLEK